MGENTYEEYSNIKIESLTKFWGYSRNKAAYNRLKSNNIKTLQDLFQKYDTDSFIFLEYDEEINAQTRALIELIRHTYLKSDMLLDVYLNKEIKPFQILKNNNKSYLQIFSYLRSLGFEKRQSSGITTYISRTLNKPKYLGDILTEIFNKNVKIGGIGINEIEDLRIKLSILVSYYVNKKVQVLEHTKSQVEPNTQDPIINDMYIKSLEEEEQELLEHRAKIDKKLAIVRSKIQELKQQKTEGKTL